MAGSPYGELAERKKTMTREEEIIKGLESVKKECGEHLNESFAWICEPINKAIKALSAEPCEDSISRQAAQAKIKSICDEYRLSYEDGERKAATGGSAYALGHAFDELPPVTPQPRTGYWILADEQNKEDVENDNYRFICSKCQCSDIHAKGTIVPYCWKCGTKMVEPKESEE